VEAYLNELNSESPAGAPRRARRAWTIIRHATLGVGLLIAALQYYLIDIYVQIASLQRVQFLTPDAAPALQRSALELLRLLC
jgi:hypothetical protein